MAASTHILSRTRTFTLGLAGVLALAFVPNSCGDDASSTPGAQKIDPVRYDASVIEDPDVIKLLDKMILEVEARPSSARAHRSLGLAYEANDQFVQAVRSFENSLILDPNSLVTQLHVGLCKKSDGAPLEAIAAMEKAIEMIPKDDSVLDRVSLRCQLGALYLDESRLDDAGAQFQGVLDEREDVVMVRGPAQLGLAQVMIENEQPKKALPLIQAALEGLPGDPFALFQLGRAYRDLDRMADADKLPTLPEKILPKTYGNSLSSELARYAVSKAKRLSLVGDLAGLQDNQKDLEALEILFDLQKTYPDDEVVMNNLSAILMRVGRHAEALEILEKILAADKTHFAAWYNTSYCHMYGGDQARIASQSLPQTMENAQEIDNLTVEAVSAYQQALIAAENAVLYVTQVAEMHLQLAKALMVNRRPVDAMDSLNEALRLGSDDVDIYFNLAKMERLKLGVDKAIATMRRCLEKNPGYTDGRLVLAQFLEEINDISGMTEQYEELVRRGSIPYPQGVGALATRLGRNLAQDAKKLGMSIGK